ncbi:MAG TPA: hypothetical protein PLM19_05425, partial [Candidatus Syntrophosphaera sp.]|nr:hypothetical protein [Candidatus Syntrophosphaera sp.]
IEEVHRHFKQSYGWEKIQFASYTRLQNLNQILLLAMCFLYSLKKFAYPLSAGISQHYVLYQQNVEKDP